MLGYQEIDEVKLIAHYSCIINGLFYMHNNCLAHCDLKPQNILVQGPTAKIADFGSLAYVSELNIDSLDNG